MQHAEYFSAIVEFLREVGLVVESGVLPADTFLPGLAIRAGGLVVDPERLIWPGDLLHEAGHLAVLPAELRVSAGDGEVTPVDVKFASELEAMAWAYAAAVHLEIPMEVLIHDGGYNGKANELLQMYSFGVYPGLRGLCEIGMTSASGFTAEPVVTTYPKMLRWLRC